MKIFGAHPTEGFVPVKLRMSESALEQAARACYETAHPSATISWEILTPTQREVWRRVVLVANRPEYKTVVRA